jgi:cytochrome c oxidase subunit 2
LILVVIAVPSFRLLFLQYSFPKPDMTIKAVGNAWFWEHQYPDVKDRGGRPLNITSNMITDTDLVKTEIGDAEFDRRYGKLPELQKLKAVQEAAVPLWAGTSAKVKAKYGDRLVRQLSVDNEIAVPVGKTIHLLITSNDVIHSWTIPSFGSKMQAVPGRVTATWFKPDKIGVYYGQCSVLCGKLHSGMPIAVRVVSDKAYGDWIAALQAGDRNRARTILQTATAQVEPKTLAALSN